MFVRILHHSYRRQGLALDDTEFDNHGLSYDTSYEPDGAALSSGAAHFGDQSSRVRIATNDSWKSLRAVRVVTQVRLDALNPHRSNLVEAHLSFAFFITNAGVLTATFLGPQTPGGPKVWHGVSSTPPYSPDGATHTVPVGEWVTLAFMHDGFASMSLSINGKVVGVTRDIIAPVPSVGSLGVHIGNWPDANAYTLMGSIDDIVVDKYDQDALKREVLTRPWGENEADCWIYILNALGEAFESGDQTALNLLAVVGWLRDSVVRGLLRKDESIQKRNTDYALRFLELWSTGRMASSEMEELLVDWFCWLKIYGGVDLSALANSLSASSMAHERGTLLDFGSLVERLGHRECDPEFIEFLRIIERVLEGLKNCVGEGEPSHAGEERK